MWYYRGAWRCVWTVIRLLPDIWFWRSCISLIFKKTWSWSVNEQILNRIRLLWIESKWFRKFVVIPRMIIRWLDIRSICDLCCYKVVYNSLFMYHEAVRGSVSIQKHPSFRCKHPSLQFFSNWNHWHRFSSSSEAFFLKDWALCFSCD